MDELLRARNAFEAQAAYEHLKKVLDRDISGTEFQEALNTLRDTAHDIVLADALADYNANPKLYPERVGILYNLLPRFEGKCTAARLGMEETKLLKDIWERFDELGECKSELQIYSLVDELFRLFEQHPEYREAGYRRLRWEIEKEIIGAYLEVFFSMNRPWLEHYHTSLLVAAEELCVRDYKLDFLYFDNRRFEVLTPENVCGEKDLTTLRKKLETLVTALSHADILVFSAYMDSLTDEIASAVLNTLESLHDWAEVSETAKLRERYLGSLLRDRLRGLTESVDEQEFDSALDNFVFAQLYLHRVCTNTDAGYLENNWSEFLFYAASSPDLDALTTQSILALTVSLMSEIETSGMPETLQCLVRFLTAIVSWPMSVTYKDNVCEWIINGDVA